MQPIQKIIFGSPGTGKSNKIRQIAEKKLEIKFDEVTKILPNTVKTVFHPEYTYSDFMGKLLPLTQSGSVVYKYYAGHFLKALGMAYRGLIENNGQHYLLVIDELNRGNAAAIFGSVFQLLDREDDGWSSYEIDISEMELAAILNLVGYTAKILDGDVQVDGNKFKNFFDTVTNNNSSKSALRVLNYLRNYKICIPPNLSIIATINTSDESIYYLDSAFKRRWSWEYVSAPDITDIRFSEEWCELNFIPDGIINISIYTLDGKCLKWYRCIVGINVFIKSQHQSIRRIEDKQIGWWFIKPRNGGITLEDVQDKLMFYLWDSVFDRDKKPLVQLINDKLKQQNVNIITYGDFVSQTSNYLQYWHDSVPAVANFKPDINYASDNF